MSSRGLASRLVGGDRRALAKAITVVENGGKDASRLLREIGPGVGDSFVVGVTGPPGTGKSTLVNRLTEDYRRRGLKVGVVAIDPTSPITGGALLGDRIRMVEHATDKGVFIRSMASRGWTGGLSAAVSDVIQVLDAAGMDVILVETVGIGQSDIDIMKVAHVVMVVVMPGMGDDVQASKAGLMEVGDVYVVNKGDLSGADAAVVDLLSVARASKRSPSVLKVSALKNEGIEVLSRVLEKRRAAFHSADGEGMKQRSVEGMITELARRKALLKVERKRGDVRRLAGRVMARELTIDEAADRLFRG